MSEHPKAHMANCYEWACDNCGMAQIARALPYEATDEEMRELHDLPKMGGIIQQCPRMVKCLNCATVHVCRYADLDDGATP